MRTGDIEVWAALHPSGNWIVLPLTVDGVVHLLMVLDTGSPVSALSPGAIENLHRHRLLRPVADPRQFVLTNLTAQGQPLPDMAVRVLPRLTRLQVDGLLGLDFLRSFEAIHFHVGTLRLILESRSP